MTGNVCRLRKRLEGKKGCKGKPGDLSDMKISHLKSSTEDVQKPRRRLSTEEASYGGYGDNLAIGQKRLLFGGRGL